VLRLLASCSTIEKLLVPAWRQKKTNGSNIFEFGVVEMDELEFFLREHKWKMSIQKKYVRIQIQILYFHL
jgi:hypothetical protein